MADFNVAVIESDPALRSQLIADLGERVRAAAFPTIESLEERLEDGTPVVALLGPSCAGPAGLIAVERLHAVASRGRHGADGRRAVDRRAAAGASRRCEGRAGGAGPGRRARPRRRAGRWNACSGHSEHARDRVARSSRRIRATHHGLLHQGWRRQVGDRGEPGGDARSPLRPAGGARRCRPAVRRRRGDAQVGAAAHDRRRGQRDRQARRPAPAEPSRSS